MKQELPQLSSYSASSISYDPNQLCGIGGGFGTIAGGYDVHQFNKKLNEHQALYNQSVILNRVEEPVRKEKKEKVKMSGKRVVQVFIVDTDNNLPVRAALLYKSDQQFTDLTDQELFFEIDIKNMLAIHNDIRAKILDKKLSTAAEKVFLEPIKIRDLKMTVTVLAEF